MRPRRLRGLSWDMIVVMDSSASRAHVDAVVRRIRDLGCDAHVSVGRSRTVIGVVGDRSRLTPDIFDSLPGVSHTMRVSAPFKFVSREFQPAPSVVTAGSGDAVARFGAGHFGVIAGPCAVESRDQLFRTAERVASAGAVMLRGDAFKPRTSPYSFQGLGERGLELLAQAREEFGLPFVAEVVDPRDVPLVASYADMLRVGTRNMANFPLLSEVGRARKPVQLKRGFTATIDEWLQAAEYIFKEGNHDILLVERGIRTFEQSTRNTLDVSAVPVLHGLSHLPVLVDPSHAGGRRELVSPLAAAAVAAGADGLMVDVHVDPSSAKVDAAQAIVPDEFDDLMEVVSRVRQAVAV